VHGVFWSDDLQQLTLESSRQFHLTCVDEGELTRIADLVAGQFGQESVLTFAYQPDDAAPVDSFIAEVSGVDVQRFHNALAADPDTRSRLGGGSINENGSLVLVAAYEDAEVAKRVVAVSGGDLDMPGVRHGTSRFVPQSRGTEIYNVCRSDGTTVAARPRSGALTKKSNMST
jgi:hypothetical protein